MRTQLRVPTAHAQEVLSFVNGPAVFWDLSCVPEDKEGGQLCGSGSGYLSYLGTRSPSPVSTVSGHPRYCVRSLWSSPVLYLQSLVISCTMSAVSGHLLYYVRSLWSSPVL
ncbi:unnamed protein product, partial [Staurois parvus]